VSGRFRLTIFKNDLATPIASFDDSNILSEVSWRPHLPLDDKPNIIRGTYVDPSDMSLYQPRSYPERKIASVDGNNRFDSFNLSHVESPDQSQRLVRIRAKRLEYAGVLKLVTDATGWRAQKNAIVTVTRESRGWVNKLFRVQSIEHRYDGTVPLVLVEENADIYGAPTLAPVAPVVANTAYNYLLNPFILAIDETSRALVLENSKTLGVVGAISQADAGTNVTLTIPTHTRIYGAPYANVSVTGASMTGLAYATEYHLAYDDATFAGGAVTYAVYANEIDARPMPDHPDRHYITKFTTIASGGGGGGFNYDPPPGGYQIP
jgi:hypothetical protein